MWKEQRKAVLDAALELVKKGMVIGTAGNVSMRLQRKNSLQNLISITPSNRDYDSLSIDDIVVVDFNGEPVEGNLKPSVETMLHIGIYKARKKINAIVHSHSTFGSIFSVTYQDIPAIMEDQVDCLGSEIKVANYALHGSQELMKNVISALGPNNAVILANHGTLSVGKNMREAITNCEMLEKTARIYMCALAVGRVNKLPPEGIEKEKTWFNLQYGEAEK